MEVTMAGAEQILDVRSEPPARRHEKFLYTSKALAGG
jgi:hypothetical protein